VADRFATGAAAGYRGAVRSPEPATARRALVRGSTIGCRKLDRFEPRPMQRLRVRFEDAIAGPLPARVRG
jgi:hypothetical protein